MNIKIKKELGQHFLIDKNIAANISEALLNKDNLPILEVGPGKGILTDELIKKNNKLFLVEIDKEIVEYLKEKYNSEFTLIHEDFLKLNIENYISNEFVIIGNLPYNISSQIFFKILENKTQIPEVVCMIQKEVAQRIASKHNCKQYGILSVILQLFYEIEYLFTVNEMVFVPPPKVKSAVIRLKRYRTSIEDVDEKKLLNMIKTIFNQRRKTIRNSIKPVITQQTNTEHVFFNMRPEQLSPEDFVTLLKIIQ